MTYIYGVGNQGSGLGQAQKCDWVKLVKGILSLLDNWISNSKRYKQTINLLRFSSTRKDHTASQK